MLDDEATLAAISSGVSFRRRACEVITVDGPDARSYLQGQLSQDLDPLVVGEATEAFLLEPGGKVVSFLRVHLVGDDVVHLIVEDGYGEAAEERLRRFKLRVRAELSRERQSLIELRGPKARELLAAFDVQPSAVLEVAWPGYLGVDVIGVDLDLDASHEGGSEAFELSRILAGVPVMGAEITEKTIPQELGITDRAVSFTKGCYTGQELVARIDARGNNVARRLCLVRSKNGVRLVSPAELVVDGVVAGTLTSAAAVAGDAAALGFVKRAITVPSDGEVLTAAVHIEALSPALS